MESSSTDDMSVRVVRCFHTMARVSCHVLDVSFPNNSSLRTGIPRSSNRLSADAFVTGDGREESLLAKYTLENRDVDLVRRKSSNNSTGLRSWLQLKTKIGKASSLMLLDRSHSTVASMDWGVCAPSR
mmetsp:Transcript_9877/g.20553  ORF Transcript_9877/g.20553 Transcript_9877/m.20553 type:complete len:128 (+) Transcript_9877:260-643(+)